MGEDDGGEGRGKGKGISSCGFYLKSRTQRKGSKMSASPFLRSDSSPADTNAVWRPVWLEALLLLLLSFTFFCCNIRGWGGAAVLVAMLHWVSFCAGLLSLVFFLLIAVVSSSFLFIYFFKIDPTFCCFVVMSRLAFLSCFGHCANVDV